MTAEKLWGFVFSAVVCVSLSYLVMHPEKSPLTPAPVPIPQRPTLVVLGAKWCPACLRLERDTLSDAKVKETLANRFIYSKVQATKQACERYAVTELPAYIVLQNGIEVKRGTGYRTPQEFLQWLP